MGNLFRCPTCDGYGYTRVQADGDVVLCRLCGGYGEYCQVCVKFGGGCGHTMGELSLKRSSPIVWSK